MSHESYKILPPLIVNESYKHRESIPSLFGTVCPMATSMGGGGGDWGFLLRTNAYRRTWKQILAKMERIVYTYVDHGAARIVSFVSRSATTPFREVPLVFARSGASVADHRVVFDRLHQFLSRGILTGSHNDVDSQPLMSPPLQPCLCAVLNPATCALGLDHTVGNLLYQFSSQHGNASTLDVFRTAPQKVGFIRLFRTWCRESRLYHSDDASLTDELFCKSSEADSSSTSQHLQLSSVSLAPNNDTRLRGTRPHRACANARTKTSSTDNDATTVCDNSDNRAVRSATPPPPPALAILISAAEHCHPVVLATLIELCSRLRDSDGIPIVIVLGISTSVRYVESRIGPTALSYAEAVPIDLLPSTLVASEILKCVASDALMLTFSLTWPFLKCIEDHFFMYHFSVTSLIRDLYIACGTFFQLKPLSFLALPLKDLCSLPQSLSPSGTEQQDLGHRLIRGLGHLAARGESVHEIESLLKDCPEDVKTLSGENVPPAQRIARIPHTSRDDQSGRDVASEFITRLMMAKHQRSKLISSDILPKEIVWLMARRIAFSGGLRFLDAAQVLLDLRCKSTYMAILEELYDVAKTADTSFPTGDVARERMTTSMAEATHRLCEATRQVSDAVRRLGGVDPQTSLLHAVGASVASESGAGGMVERKRLPAHSRNRTTPLTVSSTVSRRITGDLLLKAQHILSEILPVLAFLYRTAHEHEKAVEFSELSAELDGLSSQFVKSQLSDVDGIPAPQDNRILLMEGEGRGKRELAGPRGAWTPRQREITVKIAKWLERVMDRLFFPLPHQHILAPRCIIHHSPPAGPLTWITPQLQQRALESLAGTRRRAKELACICCNLHAAGTDSAVTLASMEDLTILYRQLERCDKQIDVWRYFVAFCHAATAGNKDSVGSDAGGCTCLECLFGRFGLGVEGLVWLGLVKAPVLTANGRVAGDQVDDENENNGRSSVGTADGERYNDATRHPSAGPTKEGRMIRHSAKVKPLSAAERLAVEKTLRGAKMKKIHFGKVWLNGRIEDHLCSMADTAAAAAAARG